MSYLLDMITREKQQNKLCVIVTEPDTVDDFHKYLDYHKHVMLLIILNLNDYDDLAVKKSITFVTFASEKSAFLRSASERSAPEKFTIKQP
jgi:hypothetical protein